MKYNNIPLENNIPTIRNNILSLFDFSAKR